MFKLESDSLLQLRKDDTLDCGAVINLLFHRSSYKFPIDYGYTKDELTAVIADGKDSILSIKIMFIDTVAHYRETLDWLKLNCKNKKLQTIEKEGFSYKIEEIKYDTRILDILMRKCALDYWFFLERCLVMKLIYISCKMIS